MPTEHSIRYFQEASSDLSVRRWLTRNVVAIVVASMETHSTPRFAASTASSMQVMKACINVA